MGKRPIIDAPSAASTDVLPIVGTDECKKIRNKVKDALERCSDIEDANKANMKLLENILDMLEMREDSPQPPSAISTIVPNTQTDDDNTEVAQAIEHDREESPSQPSKIRRLGCALFQTPTSGERKS